MKADFNTSHLLSLWEKNTNDVFAVWSKNYRLLYVSPNFENLYGRSKESFEKNYFIFLRWILPVDRLRVIKNSISARLSKKEYNEFYFRCKMPDGTIKWIWTREQRIQIPDSNKNYILGISSDVTLQKTLENELSRHRAELENKIKDRTNELEQLNEEYLAINEEYETLNEELKAANEDLQISNEHLQEEIRKRTEAVFALEESEEKFRAFIEQTTEGISMLDSSGKVIEWNRMMAETLQMKKEEVIGKYIWDIEYNYLPAERQTPQTKENIKKAALDYIAQGSKATVLIREGYYHVNGEQKYLFLVIFPVITRRGIYVGRVLINRTEHKKKDDELHNYRNHLEQMIAERTEELQRSEARLSMIARHLPMAFYIISIHVNKSIWVSSQIKDITGYDTDIFINNVDFWETRIHPEDREEVMRRYNAHLSKGIIECEYRWQLASGEYKWFLDQAVVTGRDDNGNPTELIGCWIDITQKKEAEQALRQAGSIVENIQLGMHIYHLKDINDDRSLVMVAANPASEVLTGVKMKDVIGKTIDENFPGLRAKNIPQQYADVVRNQKPIQIEDIYYSDERVIAGAYSVRAFPLPGNHICVAFENITERLNNQRLLRENEEKYRLLSMLTTDTASSLIVNKDGSFTREWFTDNLFSQYGYEPSEVDTFDKWAKVVHPDDLGIYYNERQRLLKGETVSVDIRILTKNGEVRWINNTIYPQSIPETGQIRFLSAVKDITDRKLGEKAIEQANTELKRQVSFNAALMASLPIPVFFKDLHGKYIGCNMAFTEIMGKTTEEIRGKTVMELWPGEMAEVYHRQDLDLLKKPEHQQYEFKVKDKQGIVRNVIFNKDVFFDDSGKIAGIVGSFLDITNLKKSEAVIRASEEKFRLLFENANDTILILKNDKIIDFNERTIALFGIKDKNEILGTDLCHLSAPQQPDGVESCNKIKTMKTTIIDGTIKFIEWRFQRSDKSEFDAEVSFSILTMNEEKLVQVIIRDITERKNIERKIFDTIIETEERERQRLAQDLHDEIGPILSSLKMYISVLDTSAQKEKIDYISLQVKELIKQAVRTVREISNALSPHVLTNFGLHAALGAAVENAREFISIQFESNLNEVRFQPNVEIVFYRILKELLNNTIKHAGATEIKIQLNFDGTLLRLIYADNGVGFDYENVLSKTAKGFGLYNILSRVKSINGLYTVSSGKNKGFQFELKAPTVTM